MIRKITYDIRFPFDSLFSSDPRFLFIRNIYSEIKRLTCFNLESKCLDCELKDKCVYHKLSGENFYQYPALLINKPILEKKNFKRNSILQITFYLIGDMEKYEGFILEYFQTKEYLEGIYFQKRLIENIIIDNNDLINKEIKVNNPIYNLEEINDCINYLNNHYHMKLNNDLTICPINIKNINDYHDYSINYHHFNVSGIIGTFNVTNYPSVLLEIGVGKNMIFTGGKDENKN